MFVLHNIKVREAIGIAPRQNDKQLFAFLGFLAMLALLALMATIEIAKAEATLPPTAGGGTS
mgnify:CR=1 FL=1